MAKFHIFGKMKVKDYYTAFSKMHIEDATGMALANAAVAIRDAAKRRAPIQTGALRESLSVATFFHNDAQSNAQRALRLRPGANIVTLFQDTSQTKLKASIFSPLHYAGYQEFGTLRNAAQPYLIPALHEVGPRVIPDSIRAQVAVHSSKTKPKRYTVRF